jgi:hypothetical protein
VEVNGQLDALSTLPQGKGPLIPVRYDAWWAPELVWILWRRENLLPVVGFEPQPVAMLTELSLLQQFI